MEIFNSSTAACKQSLRTIDSIVGDPYCIQSGNRIIRGCLQGIRDREFGTDAPGICTAVISVGYKWKVENISSWWIDRIIASIGGNVRIPSNSFQGVSFSRALHGTPRNENDQPSSFERCRLRSATQRRLWRTIFYSKTCVLLISDAPSKSEKRSGWGTSKRGVSDPYSSS